VARECEGCLRGWREPYGWPGYHVYFGYRPCTRGPIERELRAYPDSLTCPAVDLVVGAFMDLRRRGSDAGWLEAWSDAIEAAAELGL
jgi:hypothetical protein